jgi:endonuclease G, mitochondrial
MKTTMNVLFVLGTLAIAHSANATNCPQHYFQREPQLTATLMMDKELCNEAFAIGYNYHSRTAIYSAEHLTAAAVNKAKRLKRNDEFHPDDRLPEAAQSWLTDYRGSGFDRGHLAPNADMPTPSAQYESFSLSNMVPQLHIQNAGIWSAIESTVRELALQNGDVYIVTAGIYDGTTQAIKNRVPVPNAMYKAVYVPAAGMFGVYVSNNDSSNTYQIVSLSDLQKRTGVSPFPALSGYRTKKSLPAPHVRPSKKHNSTSKSNIFDFQW